MKVRNRGRGSDKIELQMTPMIDIVFQLLVFFIMTFKVVSMEGDFNIKMPQAAPSAAPPEQIEFPPLKLYMTANENGDLSSLTLNEQSFEGNNPFIELNRYIQQEIGLDGGPGSARETAEIEIGFDFNLKYTHVIGAITAVSGTKDQRTNEILPLIEKVRFTPPRAAE